MRIRRSVTGMFATAMASGALLTALTVTTPNEYYDMSNPAAISNTVVVDSVTTTSVTTDEYYDM